MPRLAAPLTKTSIMAMSRNSELADHTVPGLRLWRGARKRGWSLMYVAPNGKRCRLRLGSPDTGTDIEAARASARTALSLLAQGIDPRHPPQAVTVGEALDRYEREYLEHRRTGRDIARLLRKELVGRFGAMPIAALERSHLAAMHSEIRARAPICANRSLGYTRTMLAWAVAVGLVHTNAAADLKRHVRAKERPRTRILTDAELHTLWTATLTSKRFPDWYGALVRLGMLTGQRRGEITSLRSDWIDDQGWVTVPAAFYKTEQPHRFFMTPFALAQICAFPADPPWSRYKRGLDAAVGFDGWTLHDLRRTFATGLRRLGEQKDIVELCLGHVLHGMVRVYQVYDFECERQAAFERWSRHIETLTRA